MSERTALVTGGAGFIGSHLCDSLLDDGYRVVCLDNLGSGRIENLDTARESERFEFVEGDVRQPLEETLSEGQFDPESVSRIYHLASRASPADFESNPLEIAETNSRGTRHVLEFARSADARVLYTSTSEVYGDPEQHPQSESYFGNVDPRGPRACYDESKRYGEMLTSVYYREYDLDVRTARIFNTYGPRMNPTDGRVIPNFLSQALDGDDLTVYGDGTQTRSFVFVADEVRGLRALMDTEGMDGEVVNVGSTDEITINDLAETVLDVVDTDSGVTSQPLPHESDPERRRPDSTKAREQLDWEPSIALEEGLVQTVEYFRRARSPSV